MLVLLDLFKNFLVLASRVYIGVVKGALLVWVRVYGSRVLCSGFLGMLLIIFIFYSIDVLFFFTFMIMFILIKVYLFFSKIILYDNIFPYSIFFFFFRFLLIKILASVFIYCYKSYIHYSRYVIFLDLIIVELDWWFWVRWVIKSATDFC